MKIYISGQISGLPLNEVKAKFQDAEKRIVEHGYEAVNPLKNGIPSTESWEVHMAADIVLLLDCDAIYMLPGWESSKGATLEKNIAERIGKKIILPQSQQKLF